MRVLLTSLKCPKGELELNLAGHLDILQSAADAGCDLALLPEMSLTGYHPGTAIALEHRAVAALVAATSDTPAISFGLVELAQDGRPPYITQVLAQQGKIATVHRKMSLGEGEDADFQPGHAAGPFVVDGVSCALAVCAEIGTSAPYETGARLILGPSAPGLYGDRRTTDERWQRGFDWWHGSVLDDARRLLKPGQYLAVSTQAGATYDEDFPGWAGLVASGGRVVAELPDWHEGELVVEVSP